MPKYILLLTGPADYATLSPEEGEKTLKDYMEWTKSLQAGGHLIGAERLRPEYRIIQPGPTPTVTDGPFAESKEAVGGYFAIEADDLDQATQLGKGCPHLAHGGYVHIRPIWDMSGEDTKVEAAAARG